MGADEGDAFIDFTPTEILAGGVGAESLATKAELQAVVDAFNGHTHAVNDIQSGTSTTFTSGASGAPNPGGTTVLKGK